MKKEVLEIIQAWLDGAVVQWRIFRHDEWNTLPTASSSAHDVSFDGRLEYRVRPKTIRIGARDVPAPEVKYPNVGDTYFIADPSSPYGPPDFIWGGGDCDVRQLINGMVHLNESHAREHAEALIAVSIGKP